jgi:hypothetical protein
MCFRGNGFGYLFGCRIEIPNGSGSFTGFWILKGIDFILYSSIMYWLVIVFLLGQQASFFA